VRLKKRTGTYGSTESIGAGLFREENYLALFTVPTSPFSSEKYLQAIYVPADDLTDPAPATTFAHLDATTVLSR